MISLRNRANMSPSGNEGIHEGSGDIFAGVKAITQRMKDVDAACHNIVDLWPHI
jgi:hypothetical protein